VKENKEKSDLKTLRTRFAKYFRDDISQRLIKRRRNSKTMKEEFDTILIETESNLSIKSHAQQSLARQSMKQLRRGIAIKESIRKLQTFI
jgi:hypothetical protein